MSRSDLYCSECGARLTLYVIGICDRCLYDMTGRDDNRVPPQEPVSDPETAEA
jgi:hypothetical protein